MTLLDQMKMSALALVVALGTMSASASRASAQTVDEIVKRGKVTIGVLVGAPPYGSVDAQGNPIGYDADVIALIGKYMGVPVEMVPLTPPARIPALQAKKVDFLVATLAPTPERARAVMFTMPYSAFQTGIYSRKDVTVKGWADLKGKRVGVNRGSPLEAEFVKREKDLDLKILRFEDDATTMQALFSGQVEAVAEPDAQANSAIKSQNTSDFEAKFFFGKQPNSMTVRKDAYELRQWLNNVIYYIKNNGELDAIAQKWIGAPLPELPVF
jgi:polar amino acid transport system substrate-binding protein